MQGLLDAGIQLLLFFFSFLTPKKKNLILFGSGPADEFHGNPKYLFLYLVNNQTAWEYYWVTGSKARYKTLRDRDLPVLYKYSKPSGRSSGAGSWWWRNLPGMFTI